MGYRLYRVGKREQLIPVGKMGRLRVFTAYKWLHQPNITPK